MYFVVERQANANRDYGVIYLGPDPNTAENVTETLVREGYVSVRKDNARTPTPELQKLLDLEEAAKSEGKNKWGNTSNEHVRSIKWTQENQRYFIDQLNGKPVNAIIEHVRDGSTVRAFLLPHPDYSNLVPDYQYITLMISGIRVSFNCLCSKKKKLGRNTSFQITTNYFPFRNSVPDLNWIVMANQTTALRLTMPKRQDTLSNHVCCNAMCRSSWNPSTIPTLSVRFSSPRVTLLRLFYAKVSPNALTGVWHS